jgi:hypothetical protein
VLTVGSNSVLVAHVTTLTASDFLFT